MVYNAYICSRRGAFSSPLSHSIMTRHSTLLTFLFACAASSSVAQTDRSLGYGVQSYAIPGTSAVGFNAPQAVAPQAVAQTYIGQPSTDSASSAACSAQETGDSEPAAADGEWAEADSAYAAPAGYWDYGGLHTGLNVSLGMSVFAQFGKHARHGAGFTQTIDAIYLQPLGKRAWLAVGGYIHHTNWSGDSYTTGGIYGELGYQFDEHWSAYIYGQKSLVNDGSGYDGYGMGYGYYGMYGMPGYDCGDKLGAAVRWTPNHNFSLQLSVEKDWYPRQSRPFSKFKYSDSLSTSDTNSSGSFGNGGR